MTSRPPSLTPEMLLFEVAAMCSRHGIPVSTANPGAAVEHATRLLQTLGVMTAEPAAIEAAPPVTPDEIADAISSARRGWSLNLPAELPTPTASPLARRPVDALTFDRGRAPVPGGSHRVLRLAPENGAS